MKQNLGKLDRIFRFILAFWWLSAWAPSFETDWLNVAVIIIAWIALLESFAGWCWIHTILRIDNKHQ